MQPNWIDRLITTVAPRYGLQRMRARHASALLARNYEAASTGRRTQGWRKSSTDANAAASGSLGTLRDVARDLVRNNPYAESALTTISDHVIGSWGITPSVEPPQWKVWADSTLCDADGRNTFYGLQRLVIRSVVESGEVLIRRRIRRPEDNLPIPLQLQILEPDYLDTLKNDVIRNETGIVIRRIIQGIEFDALGRRAAYWLFDEHPGSASAAVLTSHRIPATEILHIYEQKRPGQARGVSWFGSVLLRFKDFDEFEDATLMKQKVAACLAVLTTDIDGSGAPIGSVDSASPLVDMIEPGAILNLPPGRDVKVVEPPAVREYSDYCKNQLRAIATGLGVTFEDLTGNYDGLPFSAARMSRLRHWSRVEDWRWNLLIPQFLNPVWAWAVEVGTVAGLKIPATTEWNAPPLPMIEPDKEGLAIQRNIRSGIQTLKQAIKERGLNYEQFLDELQNDFKELDKRGLVLDMDPRKVTQAGQLQGAAATAGTTEDEPDDEDVERFLRVVERAFRRDKLAHHGNGHR